MVTGDLRSKIDRIWDAFWSGGISNPLEVIEQITYLLFIKRLDDLADAGGEQGRPARRADGTHDLPRGPDGIDATRVTRAAGRTPTCAGPGSSTWRRPRCTRSSASTSSRSCRRSAARSSTYATHMRGARFTIPTPALLQKAVDGLDEIPMDDRDTKGDVYEYMLGKIATAGQNGQFRTPRHIIQLMVEMTGADADRRDLRPGVRHLRLPRRGGRVLRATPSRGAPRPEAEREHFHHEMFNGFDFDSTMLRIGSMNMLLHGVEQPDVRYRDSLAAGPRRPRRDATR